MKIQVLGTGCTKCSELLAETEKAIARAGVDVDLAKVDKIEEIVGFGVVFTPALVIDGEVKAAGAVPRAEQIVAWIREAGRKE